MLAFLTVLTLSRNNLKETRSVWAYGFRGSSTWSAGSIAGDLSDAEHHVGSRVKQLTSCQTGCRQRQTERSPGKNTAPKTCSRDLLLLSRPYLQVSATSTIPPNHELLNELIHSLEQSPCDPITSQEQIHQLETKPKFMSLQGYLLSHPYDKARTKPYGKYCVLNTMN